MADLTHHNPALIVQANLDIPSEVHGVTMLYVVTIECIDEKFKVTTDNDEARNSFPPNEPYIETHDDLYEALKDFNERIEWLAERAYRNRGIKTCPMEQRKEDKVAAASE